MSGVQQEITLPQKTVRNLILDQFPRENNILGPEKQYRKMPENPPRIVCISPTARGEYADGVFQKFGYYVKENFKLIA